MDVLSQAEIDALLDALSDGQVSADDMKSKQANKKVRSYDFKRPNKFSKDQIHSLQNIHDNYCRTLTTYLSGHLHSVIDTKVMSIEQITYDEFTRSLPNPTVLGIFKMNPLEGTLLIEINPSLAFIMIERILGGQGDIKEKSRDLTDIERTLLEYRITSMIQLLEDAWSDVFKGKSEFVALDTNPQFTQIAAPNDMIVLINLEITVGESTGMINLCLPYLVLEPILDKLNTLLLFSTQAKVTSPEQTQAIHRKIEWAKVDVTALLGVTEITVKDLLSLNNGDVIPLTQNVKEPLSVYVEEFKKFKGFAGLYSENMAIQLTDVLEEGSDENV